MCCVNCATDPAGTSNLEIARSLLFGSHQSSFFSQFIAVEPNMIFKTVIVYLIIQLVAASLEEISDAAAVLQHERAPIPGALVPLPEMAASTKGVHLSVTTGTPGVWYPGKRMFFCGFSFKNSVFTSYFFISLRHWCSIQSPIPPQLLDRLR